MRVLVVPSHLQLWPPVGWRNAGTFPRMWTGTWAFSVCVCVCVCVCVFVCVCCLCVCVLAAESPVHCVFWLHAWNTWECSLCRAEDTCRLSSASQSGRFIIIFPAEPRSQEQVASPSDLPSNSFPHSSCPLKSSFALLTPQPISPGVPPPSCVYCNQNHQQPCCPVILSRGEVSV